MKQHLAACNKCGAVVRAITVVKPGDGILRAQLLDTYFSNVREFEGLPCPVCDGTVQQVEGPYNWQVVT